MPINKNNILFLLLIICLKIKICLNWKRKSFQELVDQYLGKLDINNAYLSYYQYISLLDNLTQDFPNYLEVSSIGKTYEGNEMPLITMKSPLNFKETFEEIMKHYNKTKLDNNTNENNNTNLDNNTIVNNGEIENNNTNENNIRNENNDTKIDNSSIIKTGILFNGMHHGREPVSMMMNIYLILHLLSMPKAYLHLFLSTTNIYFIPIVNIDTYKFNSDRYLLGTKIWDIMARKNRRPHLSKKCNSDDLGVDLNRNYDYYFGEDNEGSSNNPCSEDYRGDHPFSEPETLNIKNFVESHPDIKIVYNYHTWGNLIITPFNCFKKKKSDEKLQKEFPVQYEMYKDFEKEGNYPPHFLFGNADNTIKYTANGDATDWFLGKQKILSFSPELGNGKKNSDNFYPDKNVTFDILDKNLYAGIYGLQKSMYFLQAELLSAYYNDCNSKRKYNYYNTYLNRGRLYKNNHLREYDINTCASDETILNIKVKITNRGFGDYSPGLEFPFFQQITSSNNETVIIETNSNQKYFYFLIFDLKINLDDIKSVCYWNTLQTIYTVETNYNGIPKDKNFTQKDVEETQYIGQIRCSNFNKLKYNEMKIFIDNEIKSLEFIVLNLQIITKKNQFLEKIGKISPNGPKNETYNNNSELITIYTKDDKVIKSYRENGETIEWKFNNPTISVKVGDFQVGKQKSQDKKQKLVTIILISFFIVLTMTIIIITIVKKLNGRRFQDYLMDSINWPRNNDNNEDINVGMGNEQIVNNLENQEQNQDNTNTEIIQSIQIPREDSESHQISNLNSHSNSDSPTELQTQ